ncbi:MAG: GNAT family N-acetyltransferase [Planctomycetes bacterium]|jgi:ribosomal protein S18 acetylase RimI-like enzyme|nr:GNAT family N-acetyltransferase [Planctomycetota bacterium]
MAVGLDSNAVTYYKRYRMELDLIAPLPGVPSLPAGHAWIPWEDRLLDAHAEVKCQCFQDEIDGIVFPNLANRIGCATLMREIATRSGFRPEATWLIAERNNLVGTVQGVSERGGTGSIQNLGVIPSHRGRGLGLALLLQALHGFRRYGLATARLEVTAQNETAIRMYRRVGFRSRKTFYRQVEASIFSLTPYSDPEWVL